MKSIFLLVLLVVATLEAGAQEGTRRFSKSWPAADVETLMITNKYGEVKINNSSNGMVTVEVVVKVEGNASQEKALLEAVTVEFGKEGRTAKAETQIEGNLRIRNNFSIDYLVNIPSEKNLVVTNKVGNVVLDALSGKGDFHVAYGNLTASGITSSGLRLAIDYGKADIGSFQDADVVLSYSKLYVGSGRRLLLTSKYSVIEAETLEAVDLNSKYDTFGCGEVSILDGESKFTNYRIGTLEKRLKLVSAYGTVKVDHIPAGFELLDVGSTYAQVNLGIDPEASWEMDASCEYCNISYPQERFKGNRIKENTRETVQGKVASGAPGKVKVVSKYGNIKLVK